MKHLQSINAYIAVFSAQFRMLLQYRTAALAGAATQIFWGFLRIMIFTAFYQATHKVLVAGLSLSQTINYLWLSQATIMLVLIRADPEAAQAIRSGRAAYELVRPVGLYRFWYARVVAGRMAPLLLRLIPVGSVAAFFGLGLPVSWQAGVLWVVAIFVAILTAASFSVLMTISLFWTLADEGVNRFLPPLVWVASGMVVPLPFFPDWIQPFFRWMPFCGLIDIPSRIYMGNIPFQAALSFIMTQLIWTLGLICFGRWMLAIGIRRVVVQGG